MKHSLSTLLLFFTISTFLNAQTAIDFEKPQYHSSFEKEALNSTTNTFKDKVNLLLAVNAGVTKTDATSIEKLLTKHFQQLESKGVRKKSIKKKTNLIFDLTHDSFLKKYNEYAEFHQIFENGVYNCVTASALYVLIFEHFDIPFEIKELPTHVYVVAYPNTENIVVETTDPVNGIFSVNKKKYINELVSMKIISTAEFNNYTTEELYKKYANDGETVINLRQLVGDLYYNAVAQNSLAEKYELAYRFLKKGKLLYDKKTAQNSEKALLVILSTKANIDDLLSLKPLLILLNHKDYEEFSTTDIYNLNATAAEEYLINDYQPIKYEAFAQYLFKNVDVSKHEDLYKELKMVYHAQTGLSWALQSNFDKAMLHSDSAYQAKPTNLKVRSQITTIIFSQFGELANTNFAKDENVLDFIQKLETYNTKYPFLEQNSKIQEIRLFAVMYEVEDYLSNEDFEGLVIKLQEVEDKYNSMLNKSPQIKTLIEEIYSHAYGHYLRKIDDEKAKYWLEKGLSVFPDSKILLHDKELFDDYLKTKSKY